MSTVTSGLCSNSKVFPPAWPIRLERDWSRMSTVKAVITPEHVKDAYAALASGEMERIKQYWAEEMVWQVPGHNRLSGWYFGRDEFLAFMGRVRQLSGNSFRMENIAGQVIVTGEYSADITRNRGNSAEKPINRWTSKLCMSCAEEWQSDCRKRRNFW